MMGGPSQSVSSHTHTYSHQHPHTKHTHTHTHAPSHTHTHTHTNSHPTPALCSDTASPILPHVPLIFTQRPSVRPPIMCIQEQGSPQPHSRSSRSPTQPQPTTACFC